MHCLIILTVLVQCFLINRAAVLANDFISDSHGPQVIPAPSLQVEPHVLRLTRRKGSDRLIERHQQIEEVFPYGLLNLTTVRGSIYDTEISLGNKTFVVMVDTGSPETWLAKTGFECMSINRFDEEPRPEGSCMFGATYNKTEAFEPIPGEFLYMSYVDGTWVKGIFGSMNITVAGFTIRQEVGLADKASELSGDSKSSGLIGLSYPPLAEETYDGNNTTQYSSAQNRSIFFTMVKENLIQPMFSLAIERDESGGYLALGELPPVSYVDQFITTPLLRLRFGLYGITVDGVEYSGSGKVKTLTDTWPDTQMIVDSGATTIWLPRTIADEINSLFNPPAYPGLAGSLGSYYVSCDAEPPRFAVKIAGQSFWVDPQDMIIGGNGESCTSGIAYASGEPEQYTLGDVFLKNVIAVFDLGAKEMRFAPREIHHD